MNTYDIDRLLVRCEPCNYFLEGDDGRWWCTYLEKEIEDIKDYECPLNNFNDDVDETFYDPYMGCDFYE